MVHLFQVSYNTEMSHGIYTSEWVKLVLYTNFVLYASFNNFKNFNLPCKLLCLNTIKVTKFKKH